VPKKGQRDRRVLLQGPVDDGDAVSVTAEAEPVRFLLRSGKPIGEPIAWYGPIVMNTQEELRVAFEELGRGTFIKDPNVARAQGSERHRRWAAARYARVQQHDT
jgi:hypothetical protein